MQVELLNIAEVTSNTTEQKLEFALLTKEQAGVYGVICPTKETVTLEKILDYPMPDRIKDLVKLVEVEKRFKNYEVWHADAYEIKDPILLGRQSDPANPDYSWYDKFYLIARWGEELKPFKELKENAIAFMKEQSLAKAIKLKAMLNAYLENPDLFCKTEIMKGSSQIQIPDFQL